VGYACAGMRCASCGTQNEPDSRFCGGCGARLSAGESRLAPTQKVTGGAHEVQARVQAMTPAPQRVVTTPVPGAAAPVIPPTPIPAPISITPPPGSSMLDTLPPRMSGPQIARAPSAPQGVAPRAASAPFAAPAPFGSEPPRIASSVRGLSVPGVGSAGGPGGIPGTGGVPAPGRPVALPSAPTPRARMGLVIGVLVVDLALALAGGWLLSQGLSASDAPPPPPAPPPRAAPPSPS
jgi:hypothetical protein